MNNSDSSSTSEPAHSKDRWQGTLIIFSIAGVIVGILAIAGISILAYTLYEGSKF